MSRADRTAFARNFLSVVLSLAAAGAMQACGPSTQPDVVDVSGDHADAVAHDVVDAGDVHDARTNDAADATDTLPPSDAMDVADVSDAGDVVDATDVIVSDAIDVADVVDVADVPPVDVVTDAGGGIAEARAAADGTVSIAINGVFVTYVVAAIGGDPAAFFVQLDPTGPALMVAVDPATLTPVPAPGDDVSFTVTTMATVNGQREATAISGWTVNSSGHDLTPLVQDVSSAADLVSGVGGYESELISLHGTITGAFSTSGTGFVAATVDTAGVTGSTSLRLRVPTTLHDALDLAQTCTFTLPSTPLVRFNTLAEPSAWVMADITSVTCPAPRVTSAVATSPTTVLVTFDRHIQPSSVMASGAQFTFSGSLTASGAVVSGTQVTVTTSTQTGGVNYMVTVATSVTDTLGVGVDGTMNTATFTGFVSPAQLVLNEVAPNVTGSADLIELRAVSGGSVAGFTVEQNIASATVLATLPSVIVATGDLIVVHLTPPAGVTTETTTHTDCASAACYTGAWDVAGNATGITYSNRVLVVRNMSGAIQDAVGFVRNTGLTTPPAGYPADLQAIQAMAQWLPADCGGSPCTYTSTPTAQSVSAAWDGVTTTSTGSTVARVGAADTNTAADWLVGASTLGAPNP